MELLQVKNCTICYGDGNPAVKDVSFTVMEGEIVSIVGESGSGKTSMIRAITGILPAGAYISAGSILFDGLDLARADEDTLCALRGKTLAMIFQDPGSVMDPIQRIEAQYRESIRAHQKKLPAKICRELAAKMLKLMHLSDVDRTLKSYPFELSGGMQQRVGIAISMTSHPRLLLADEPTSALDVTIQAQVVNQLKQLHEQHGTSIILVTHNMGVASYISDKIGVMKGGRLVEWGKRDDVIFRPSDTYTKSLLASVPKLGGKRLAR